MLIQIFRNSYEQGFLKKERDGSSVLAPFMGGANVAFRKKAIDQAGRYDLKCLTMEDADICIRVGKLDWELYRNPTAIVKHKNPTSLKKLIKQWIGYMSHMPYLYQKHNQKAIEVFAFDRGQCKIRCVYYKIFPWRVLIVLNRSLVFYLSLLLYIVLNLMGLKLPAFIILAVGFMSFIQYLSVLIIHFYSNMKRLGYFKNGKKFSSTLTLIQFIMISYIENLTITIGSFIGGLRYGMLFIYGDPSH